MANILINTDSINFYIFPTPFVWWTKIENHLEIKNKYLPLIETDYNLNKKIYNQRSTWACNVTSSFFNESSQVFDNTFFDNVVWSSVDKMLDELSTKLYRFPIPSESRLCRVWYNKYDPGSWQEIHDHSPTFNQGETFSGVYLMDLNEKNGTVFYQQTKLRCFSSEYSQNFHTDSLDEGYVILFPSELSHYVKPSLNNKTTVSFNIASKYGNLPSN